LRGFKERWKGPEGPSLPERVRERLRPRGPLRPQVEQARHHIRREIKRVEGAVHRLKAREGELRAQLVEALQHHDSERAKALAREEAELRKMATTIDHLKTALEQVEVRLETARDLGDLTLTLSQAMSLAREAKAGLAKALPGADTALGEVMTTLDSLITGFGELTELNLAQSEVGEEAQAILAEAAAVAEKRLSENLPPLPTDERRGSQGRPLEEF
jgi:division protein CdvB (Snf7/Vps24/ESCRT-III family)